MALPRTLPRDEWNKCRYIAEAVCLDDNGNLEIVNLIKEVAEEVLKEQKESCVSKFKKDKLHYICKKYFKERNKRLCNIGKATKTAFIGIIEKYDIDIFEYGEKYEEEKKQEEEEEVERQKQEEEEKVEREKQWKELQELEVKRQKEWEELPAEVKAKCKEIIINENDEKYKNEMEKYNSRTEMRKTILQKLKDENVSVWWDEENDKPLNGSNCICIKGINYSGGIYSSFDYPSNKNVMFDRWYIKMWEEPSVRKYLKLNF